MGEFKLVAIDLDGTLLTSEGLLSVRGVDAIRRCVARGVRIVLTTARTPDTVQRFCHQLGINEPMICMNGAQVWASIDGPIWCHHAIPKSVALSIAELADENGWELCTTVESITYLKQRIGQPLGPVGTNVTVVATNSDAIRDDVLRILVYQPGAIPAIASFCKAEYPSQCRTEEFFKADGSLHSLAILAPQADKKTALGLVLTRLGITPHQSIAIGDNANDLPMLSSVGFSVAMGNAIPELKEHASVVAPDNDHDGVAWALETYVLSGR